MAPTAEEIIENIRLLPKIERDRVFKLVEAEKQQESKNGDELKRKNEKFQLALKWIDEHRKEYDGKFVVLDGDGESLKSIYATG